MKALSVIELAKLYGMNRQSIYKRINKGDLTKNSDGKIDFAEAIRVFGEPSQRSNQNVTLQSKATQNETESYVLRQQVDMLQKQLELAQEREQFQREELKAKNDQIDSLQRLLGAPKESTGKTEVPLEEHKEDVIVTTQSPTQIKQQEEPVKRQSLFGRVIRAVLD